MEIFDKVFISSKHERLSFLCNCSEYKRTEKLCARSRRHTKSKFCIPRSVEALCAKKTKTKTK